MTPTTSSSTNRLFAPGFELLIKLVHVSRLIVDSLDDTTLLAIFGDHGMTETGDHGGDSRLELESALFFYSRSKLFANEKSVSDQEIRQINLTPTLAMLLGIPVPFSNLGMVILDAFGNLEVEALKSNFLQVIVIPRLEVAIRTGAAVPKYVFVPVPEYVLEYHGFVFANSYRTICSLRYE